MAASAAATQTAPTPQDRRREWSPHIWEGCNFPAWVRLLIRGRFRVHPRFLHVVVIVTFVSLCHTLLGWLQALIYGRGIARTAIRDAPIFIVGHWRTGTTLLHELLVLDSRHSYPTTYECMAPHHFILSEGFFTRWLPFLTPSHRPMDNMKAGFDRPQEDEFALCMLGQPSPYLTIAFPNRPPSCQEYLDLRELPEQKVAAWKKTFYRFLQRVTFRNPRRLVLKSPPHSCRIGVLLELFPDARFVHIVRNPYVVFPSTVNLWKALYRTHGLQRPTFAGLEEHVFQTFTRLYERLEEGKERVGANRFHELRYEDLIADPVGQMRLLYEKIGLGDFDKVRPRLEEYLAKTSGYSTNRYEITRELRAKIQERWGKVLQRYGYQT